MAAALIGGAALGAALQELLRAVGEAAHKGIIFKSVLSRLKSTVESNIPIIKEIESFNRALDRPKEETRRLTELVSHGTKLVEECSRLKSWQFYKKPFYSDKLLRLEKSIESFFKIDMQGQSVRDTKETLLEVKELGQQMRRLSRNEKYCDGVVDCEKPFVGSCQVPGPMANVVGFDVPLQELKMELFKDGTSVIVVSAPGGSGKSTLVRMLCQDEEVRGNFKDILFITVSSSPNFDGILRKLLQYTGNSMFDFQTNEEGFNRLEQLLRQIDPDPILLVLDDAWPGSESFIEKLKFQLSHYKILVTSRHVLPRFDYVYHLWPLNDEDSMTLFRQFAFHPGNSSSIPNSLVKQLAEACKGFPLALQMVAGSLRGKDVSEWRKRVKDRSKGKSIVMSDTELLDCLESCLDALDNQQKECYFDLALFPEDHRIPATALVDMWTELHDFEDDDDSLVILHQLAEANLVNLLPSGKGADECNKLFVTQHDLLRELALHHIQSSLGKGKRVIVEARKDVQKSWLVENQQLSSAHVLSIFTDEVVSPSWQDIKVPEVKVLVLNIQTRKYTFPPFMKGMDSLKVLIVTNSSSYTTEIIDFSLLLSLINLKRLRLEQVSIPPFRSTTSQLKNLQKLSLIMCSVGQAFRNCTDSISALPSLSEIEIDYCEDLVHLPDGFCGLTKLVKLTITNCHKLCALPENIDKLEKLEVLRLSSCTKLQALPETIRGLMKLKILDISHCLNIREIPEQIGELCDLTKLDMRGCSGCDLPCTITNLKNLEEVICDKETAYQWEELVDYRIVTVKSVTEEANLSGLHLQSCF